MTAKEFKKTKTFLNRTFSDLLGVGRLGSRAATVARLTDGKLFELRALGWLVEAILTANPNLSARLAPAGAPGFSLRVYPANLSHAEPHIVLVERSSDDEVAKIWSNVQVTSRGAAERRNDPGYAETAPDYHELDIAVTAPNVAEGQSIEPSALLVGVECKDRRLRKNMLREVLGIRRLVSVLQGSARPTFPVDGLPSAVRQYPASHLILCSPRPSGAIASVELEHGITVVHLPL